MNILIIDDDKDLQSVIFSLYRNDAQVQSGLPEYLVS